MPDLLWGRGVPKTAGSGAFFTLWGSAPAGLQDPRHHRALCQHLLWADAKLITSENSIHSELRFWVETASHKPLLQCCLPPGWQGPQEDKTKARCPHYRGPKIAFMLHFFRHSPTMALHNNTTRRFPVWEAGSWACPGPSCAPWIFSQSCLSP